MKQIKSSDDVNQLVEQMFNEFPELSKLRAVQEIREKGYRRKNAMKQKINSLLKKIAKAQAQN